MSGLEFVLKLFQILAWPMTVLSAALIFRGPLIELSRRVIRAKHKETEVTLAPALADQSESLLDVEIPKKYETETPSVVVVAGDSMKPFGINSGDIAFIDKDKPLSSLKSGDIVLLKLSEGGRTNYKIRQLKAHSDEEITTNMKSRSGEKKKSFPLSTYVGLVSLTSDDKSLVKSSSGN